MLAISSLSLSVSSRNIVLHLSSFELKDVYVNILCFFVVSARDKVIIKGVSNIIGVG